MKWFKHDSNANTDAKLRKLRIRYGMEGYGLYWYCLELIASGIEHHNLTFELEHDAEILAHDSGLHVDQVQEMMTYMVDLGLFENNSGTITCLKMLSRLDSSMTSNPKMRELIQNAKKNHDRVMTKSDGVMQEENRRDKNRIDENRDGRETYVSAPRKTKPKKVFLTEDLIRYAEDKGMTEDQINDEWDKFSDWEFKSAKTDWRRAWQRWVRTWKERNPQTEALTIGVWDD